MSIHVISLLNYFIIGFVLVIKEKDLVILKVIKQQYRRMVKREKELNNKLEQYRVSNNSRFSYLFNSINFILKCWIDVWKTFQDSYMYFTSGSNRYCSAFYFLFFIHRLSFDSFRVSVANTEPRNRKSQRVHRWVSWVYCTFNLVIQDVHFLT